MDTNKRNNTPRNSAFQFHICNTAKRTEPLAPHNFLERPQNKVGGALLFFVASRDLWWGRACVLQICISGVRVTNLGVLQIV